MYNNNGGYQPNNTYNNNAGYQPNNTYPNNNPNIPYNNSTYNPPYSPALPMNWYKFLIYFALFAGAVLNFVNGITIINGTHYGTGMADIVYSQYPDLSTLDVIYGMALIAIAIFQIYTRFQLSAYKQTAPKYLTIIYTAVIASSILYLACASAILDVDVDMLMNGSTGISIGSSVGVLIANQTYFKKRQHLFVN